MQQQHVSCAVASTTLLPIIDRLHPDTSTSFMSVLPSIPPEECKCFYLEIDVHLYAHLETHTTRKKDMSA